MYNRGLTQYVKRARRPHRERDAPAPGRLGEQDGLADRPPAEGVHFHVTHPAQEPGPVQLECVAHRHLLDEAAMRSPGWWSPESSMWAFTEAMSATFDPNLTTVR